METVEWLRQDCRNGTVYGEDWRELMEKLRHVPAIATLLGTTASRTPEESVAFAWRHEKVILMGDVNLHNFLVTPECNVCMVDCDSYQFDSFACPVGAIL